MNVLKHKSLQNQVLLHENQTFIKQILMCLHSLLNL